MFSGHDEGTKNIAFVANHATPFHSNTSSFTLSSPTLPTHPPLQAPRFILVLLSSTHIYCPQVAGC